MNSSLIAIFHRIWLRTVPVQSATAAKVILKYALTAILGLLFINPAAMICSAAEASAATTCTLVEKEGKVEISRKGSSSWTAAQLNDSLQSGDRLRTGSRSRAALRWAELSVVRVNELTSMEIQPPAKPGDKAQMDLRSGATYFFSREKPTEVQFRTPVASGAIRGTEFNLAVAEDGRTVLSLLEGDVDLANAQGAATLHSREQAVVETGRAPAKSPLIDTISVIQWALYYPAVMDPADLRLGDNERNTLRNSLDAYRDGDLLAALSAYPEGRTPSSDAEKEFYAALLLSVGRVEQAQAELQNLPASSAAATALRELIAAVKHQTLASMAQPATSSEWLARSYYFQSRGQLTEALGAARAAAHASPQFGAAWVRLAELEFGFGHTDAALAALDKGLALSPRNAEGLALKGFLLSAQNQFADALASFDQAIAADGALGNAWLGRGLVRIRRGDRAGGLQDLQVATTLEPQRALLRSYLGKGWSDANDLKHARKELVRANELDPNDPTSWLYLALVDQQANRLNDSVRNLERSEDLNDNRSLFRSRLLLDQDQAVRAANLAVIYRDVGMYDRSVQEAARAVDADYANYSAHLFLASSYDSLRDPKLINLRYETPWFSELLVANLLAPPNAGNLSQNISQQEYSKLFASDGLGLFSRTDYSSHGDWIESGSQYGVFGNFAYSLDAYYRTERGFRPNNDLEQLSLAARSKWQITDKDSLFAQVSYFDSDSGDVAQYYNQSSASKSFRAEETQRPGWPGSVLAGYHREWSPGNHTLAMFGWFDDTLKLHDTNSFPLARISFPFLDTNGLPNINDFVVNPSMALNYQSELVAYSAEVQQIFQTHQQTLIAGVRYQTGSSETKTSLARPADPNNPLSVPIFVPQSVDTDLDRLSIYAYEHWQLFDNLRLIGGVSYDRLSYPRNIDTAPISEIEDRREQFSPKAGILWTPLKDTHVRLAYTRSLGGVFFDQSVRLEPVQVAGFNQAFRSLIPESVAGLVPGTRFETMSAGIDHKIEATRTYLLAQGEILKSDGARTVGLLTNDVTGGAPLTPDQASSTKQDLRFEERSLLLAGNQLVGRDWAFGVRYKLTDAKLETRFDGLPSSSRNSDNLDQNASAWLHQVDLYAIYQIPCGFFAEFDALWSQQSNRGYTPDIPGDDFWQYNLYVGYRFLQRRIEARLGLVNISDQDYRLNPLTLYNELPRERMLTVTLKVNF